jgi:serine/threonine protein kinase
MSYCLKPVCEHPQNSQIITPVNYDSGLLLQGRYRVVQSIGQGGFGRTFLAIDEARPSKPRCAIKQIWQKTARGLHQEASTLAELGNHPQIPILLDAFEQDGQEYLVQEFIDGQTLEQELVEAGAFDEREVRQLLHQLLPVLQFVHDRQVIHRDIKPANIIRRFSDGQLVLVDFGAAKAIAGLNLAKTGTVIGSAEYAAPEQVRGKAVYASDLYSLGVTCIHLLTQVPPFDLFDCGEDVWRWQDFLLATVDESLVRVLDRMLQPAIKRRYQTAAEALEDLNAQSYQVDLLKLPSTFCSEKEREEQALYKGDYNGIPLSSTPFKPETQTWHYIPDLQERSELVWAIASFMRPRLSDNGMPQKTLPPSDRKRRKLYWWMMPAFCAGAIAALATVVPLYTPATVTQIEQLLQSSINERNF